MPNHRQRKENMGEETLEINTLDSEEGLFDDYVAEDTTETAEPETTEAETETTEEAVDTADSTEPDVNSFLQVKFNGEERMLSEEEARTLAQKGMNYDRFYEPLDKLARMNDMSVGDYINQLNSAQMRFEVTKMMDSLKEDSRYEGVSDEVLEEIATAKVNDTLSLKERSYEEQMKEQADAQQEQARREIDKFLEEYPEFKDKGPEVLDQKVFDYVKKGYTLLEAYNKYLRETPPSAEVKASQLNETNRKKSIGNTSTSGSSNDGDAFLSGFNSY